MKKLMSVIAFLLVITLWVSELAFAGSLVAWGDNYYGQCNVPDGNDFKAIASGCYHSLALKSDGSIVGWGLNDHNQATPPDGSNFTAIAGGGFYSLALKSDGSIIGWGLNDYGMATPPDGNDFVAISAGGWHGLALKSDGSIVGWGSNGYGEATPPDGNDFVAVAGGGWHSLALKSDGSIVGWGANYSGQSTPPDGNNFTAISTGGHHSLALRSDGSLLAWGNNDYGQCNVPDGNNFVAIAGGGWYSLALKSDGSLVAWGRNDSGECNVPAGNNFGSIAPGNAHGLVLVKLLLLSPNGGENWMAGTTQTIRWETWDANIIPKVRLEYSINNAIDYNDVNDVNSIVANNGSYQWLIPEKNSNQCLVRISSAADANIFDVSDNTFIIFECQLNSQADLNHDCKVDFIDFAIMAQDWLRNGDPFDSGYTEAPGMVVIPGGMFQMGDSFSEGHSRERPVHTVTLDSFYMGKYEITYGQYCAFLNLAYPSQLKVVSGIVYASSDISNSYPYFDTNYELPEKQSQIEYSNGVFSVRTKQGRTLSNDPVVMVSWHGAVAYCNWLSQQEGKETCYNLSTWECDFSKNGYRLPTEAEWEYAARGGLSDKRFPWGDTISHTQANYFSDSSYSYDISPTRGYHPLWNYVINPYPYTSPEGFFDSSLRQKDDFNWPGDQSSYQTSSGANGYGLYDMTGNVWERCNDWHSDTYYSSSPYYNPRGPVSGSFHVLRGGGFGDLAINCRIAFRNIGGGAYTTPDVPYGSFGFRVVLNLK